MRSKSDEEDEGRDNAISKSTPVRLDVVIGLIGVAVVLIGGAAGAIYWGGTISAKLDTLLSQQAELTNRSNGLAKKVEDHMSEDANKWNALEGRLAIIEKSGSEATRQLAKDLVDLRVEFKVFSAMHPVKSTP